MGAPKQKWTAEEEAALKAGVVKHGAGKWRIILKDPQFSGVLALRSNVDLKDKWRNMSVTANGWGSREKARLALKRSQHHARPDDNPMALSTVDGSLDEVVDLKPLAVSNGVLQITGPKRSMSRLDNLIVEAITSLKEPSGSNKTSIAMHIEDQYWAPPNFKRLLSAKLKALTATGKLIKFIFRSSRCGSCSELADSRKGISLCQIYIQVKRKYRIAPASAFSEGRSSGMLLLEGKPRESLSVEKDDLRLLTKSQIDAELAKLRTMTAPEAAAAAARAVAEAEVAMAEAAAAAREAEAAEADAEAAQAFAEAAMMTLKSRNTSKLMVPG